MNLHHFKKPQDLQKSQNLRKLTKENSAISSELFEIMQKINEVNDKINLTLDHDILDSLIYQELSLRSQLRYILKAVRV